MNFFISGLRNRVAQARRIVDFLQPQDFGSKFDISIPQFQ
jgi:hypothetical protein